MTKIHKPKKYPFWFKVYFCIQSPRMPFCIWIYAVWLQRSMSRFIFDNFHIQSIIPSKLLKCHYSFNIPWEKSYMPSIRPNVCTGNFSFIVFLFCNPSYDFRVLKILTFLEEVLFFSTKKGTETFSHWK